MSEAYRRRIEEITSELVDRGVPRGVVAPPLWRLAWRLGLEWRPPLYRSWIVNVLSGWLMWLPTLLIGIGVGRWLDGAGPDPLPPGRLVRTVAILAVTGLLIALFVASGFRRERMKALDKGPLPPLDM